MSVVKTKPLLQTIAFVGNPNSGKTTLFNKLTGSNQKTGNFCGVTVDWVCAECTLDNQKIQLVDLPGIYTLTHVDNETLHDGCEDEKISRHFLEDNHVDVLVNVIDASNLERNLYLTLQCLELGIPTIAVLTRIDLAQKKNINFSLFHLQKLLGCPVVAVSSKTDAGIEELKTLLFNKIETPKCSFQMPDHIEEKINCLIEASDNLLSRSKVIRWLEGDASVQQLVEKKHPVLLHLKTDIAANDSELDIAMATARYRFIEKLMLKVILPSSKMHHPHFIKASKLTRWIDAFACHKWFGLPCFFAVMYVLFFFAINIGGAFQDCFEQLTEIVFVQAVGDLLHIAHFPEWLIGLGQGMGRGLTTVFTFVPVIGAMFFALAFLESSGYMSRAAIVMDRLMLLLGLPGKSFVPMIIGFGCNVPAILGARTLENKRDKILTVMMSPFMSCGARLAIFTVFVSIFFPHNGQNVVFALYLIGIMMAILTGLLLKKTLLMGPASPLIMEMPEYTLPSFRTLIRLSYLRLRRFVTNALKLIVPVCIVIGLLNSVQINKSSTDLEQQTLLSTIAKQVTPIFAPMGITQDNWPATVGLFTGILAKEVVIGSLNTLYAQPYEYGEPDPTQYKSLFKEALMSVPENLMTLRGAFNNPIAAQAPSETLDNQAHQEMLRKFGSGKAAFAYLLFILLYFPCISATAAMVKEVRKGWTAFSICWTTGLAYGVSVSYYQLSTWSQHPMLSSAWAGIMFSLLAFTIWGMHQVGKQHNNRLLPTQIVYSD